MKILKIRVLNLNSLKCTNKQPICIDLEKAPLANAGLYLITGNTGAGKSSILDAITLALYGKTDRNKGQQLQQIVSHGCEEALAEVEFELNNGERYRVRWQMTIRTVKGRKGNPDRQESRTHRELAELPSGKLLTDKPNQVEDKILGLLQGLNFEQFTRTVMLAQGEFARFLRDDKDRAAILERITDTRVYSEISNSAFERWKQANAEFVRVQTSLQAQVGQLLTEEERLQLAAEQQQLAESSLQLGEEREGLSLALLQAQDWQKWQTESQQLAADSQQWEADSQRFEPDKGKLQRHKDLAACAELLSQLDSQADTAQRLKQQIDSQEQEQISLLEKITQLNAQTESDKQAYEQALQTQQERLKLWDRAIEQDSLIKELGQQLHQQDLTPKQADLRRLEAEWERAQQAYARLLDTQAQDKETWKAWQAYEPLLSAEVFPNLKTKLLMCQQWKQKQSEYEQAISRCKQELNNNDQQQREVSQLYEKQSKERQQLREEFSKYCDLYGLGMDDYQYNELEQVSQRLKSCQDFLLSLQNLKKMLADNQQLFEQINQQNDGLGLLITEEELLAKQLLTSQELRDYWGQLWEKTEYQRKKTEYILGLQQHLHDSDSCPVCKANKANFGDWQSEISADYERELRQLEAESERIKTQITQQEGENRRLMDANQQLVQDKNKLVERLKEGYEHLVQNEEAIYLLLQTWHLQLDIKDLTDKRLQSLEKEFELKAQQYQQVISRRELWLFLYRQCSAQVEEAEARLDKYKEQATGWKQDLNRQEEEKKGLELRLGADLEGLRELFSPFTKVLPYLDNIEQLIQKLDDLYAGYARRKQQLDAAEQEARSQKQGLDSLGKELNGARERWEAELQKVEELKNRLEGLKQSRAEQFGETNPQEERALLEKQLAGLQKQLHEGEKQLLEATNQLDFGKQRLADWGLNLADTENKLYEFEQVLSTISEQAGFESLEGLKAAILPADTAKRLEDLHNRLKETKAVLDDKRRRLEEQRLQFADEVESLDIAHLGLALQANEQAQKANLSRGAQIQQLFEHYEQQSARVKDLMQIVEAKGKELARWERLKKLIGSENGKVFSQFAQALTLQRLVQVANRHLSKFIDNRYRLVQSDPQQLNLDIIDQFQANNQRSLATLSGGETFLASLALALALADLIGGKMRIYSLFIDEGFGTLDTDTLAMAVAVLQSLHNEGKNIGIISHVEQLQQQISTQIQVKAKGAGISEVFVVG